MSRFEQQLRETVATIASDIALEGFFCWHGSHELARLARASNTFTWLIVEARKCMQAHCRRLIEINHFAAEDWLALQRGRIDRAASGIPPQLDDIVAHGQALQFNAWDQWSDSTDRSMFGSPSGGRFGDLQDDRSESSDGDDGGGVTDDS